MMPIFRGEMTRKVRQSTGEVRQVRPCRHRVPVRRIMGQNAGIPQSRTTWPVADSCSMRESLTRRPAPDYAPRSAHRGRSMNDDATERVIESAKHVIGYMQSAFPGWNEVYVRFNAPSDVQYGVRASYATAAGIELISTMEPVWSTASCTLARNCATRWRMTERNSASRSFVPIPGFPIEWITNGTTTRAGTSRSSVAHPAVRTVWKRLIRWTDGRSGRGRFGNRGNGCVTDSSH